MTTIIPHYQQVLDGYNIMELSKHEYELVISGLKRTYELEYKVLIDFKRKQAEHPHADYNPEIILVKNTLERIDKLIQELEGGLQHG